MLLGPGTRGAGDIYCKVQSVRFCPDVSLRFWVYAKVLLLRYAYNDTDPMSSELFGRATPLDIQVCCECSVYCERLQDCAAADLANLLDLPSWIKEPSICWERAPSNEST
eukprot:568117-Amphidinium_carterae.1